MFNGAYNFTTEAAEYNNVGGSLHRFNSPTIFTVRNAPSGPPDYHAGYPSNAPQYPPNAPSGYAPPQQPRTHIRGDTLFAGARNFSLRGAEINNVTGDSVREFSATTMTVDYAQQGAINGNYYASERYDHARGGTYSDPASSTSGNYHGRNYDHPESGHGNHRGYPTSSGDHRPSHRFGGVSRRNSESPYPTVENRGPPDAARAAPRMQTQKPQESKRRKKNKERRRATVEQGSEDEEEEQPRISRTSTY
ncbi:hypothetical protein DFH07DRAFT_62702 [Mycena maculata]|uniref:Uncharacterized protein n=1 Tax=Mycena maculata TaxID=230809 RepID=A0AAD7IEK9_9AGAR|nr:hypothetical protein DFH07DRAFT_62702 [Mycena maculata]